MNNKQRRIPKDAALQRQAKALATPALFFAPNMLKRPKNQVRSDASPINSGASSY